MLIDRNKKNIWLDKFRKIYDEYRNSISDESAICILITILEENDFDINIINESKIFNSYNIGGYYEGPKVQNYTINKLLFNRLCKN